MIISNNPRVWDLFPETIKISGSPFDVLREVRNHVHQGQQLLGHPLMGSIRLLRNPYRSVILSKESNKVNSHCLLQVEDAYWRLSQVEFDTSRLSSLHDYQLVDLELTKAVLGLTQ